MLLLNFPKSCLDVTSSTPSLSPRCFHLHLSPGQAASRCFEGAEEVLSFVANSRSEDSLTHVILIFLHQEIGAKLFVDFPAYVWGLVAGVRAPGNPLGLGFFTDGTGAIYKTRTPSGGASLTCWSNQQHHLTPNVSIFSRVPAVESCCSIIRNSLVGFHFAWNKQPFFF